MKKLLAIIIILVVSATLSSAEDFARIANKGNEAFLEGDYGGALDLYHQAEVEQPETPELYYNMGSALLKEGKYEEALENLEKSLVTESIDNEALAHYNIGNAHYKMENYQNAIESYQKSLDINPEDIDAKFNLELARKRLKEQMKPENQNQDDQQQKKEDKQEEQKKDEQQQQQQQQEQQEEQKEQEEQQEQQQQQMEQRDENEMSKEDAERILNALKDDEKEQQENQKRFKGQGTYTGKNW